MASAAATEEVIRTAPGPLASRGGGRGRGGRGGGGRGEAGGEGRGRYAARGRGGRYRGGADEGAAGAARRGAMRHRGGGRRGDRSAQTPSSGETGGATESVLRVGQPAPPQDAEATVNATGGDDSASDPEAPLCSICADPIRYSAVPPCNHSTCHICSLRMRALYKSKLCTHCRTESEFVIFTKLGEKRFEDFKDSEIIARNDALGIKYDDQVICDDATLLLRYNCPEETCDRACSGWPDLHRHVKSEHGRILCDLCTRHKKVFTHEHELFTFPELRRHERHGDDVPGSENQSGFKGHPGCGFCNKRFYSVDELFEHCRDNHERCHICDRRSSDRNPQYYINYDALEEHFKAKHFVCLDSECLEKKFVVFANDVDLKAHQLEQHPEGLSKVARRDARRIDMSQFESLTFPYHQFRGGRGRGRGGGREREREREDEPVRTEQGLTRAEIAYHRTQQLVHSSQSTTSRTFGGQLSEPAVAAARPPDPPQPVRQPPQPSEAPPPRPSGGTPGRFSGDPPATRPSAFPPLAQPTQGAPRPARFTAAQPTGGGGGGGGNTAAVDVRAMRHGAVIERANSVFRSDATKMRSFRDDVSKFRRGEFSGSDLVDMLWSLCDVSAKELGTLINEVAELFEDETKRQELVKAWNNWKAINEDYPPIVGASSQSASTSTSSGRVLKLKSSTARSSRSAAARQTSWGAAAVLSQSSFPSLAQSNPNRIGKGAVTTTPWAAPQAPPATQSAPASRGPTPGQRQPWAAAKRDEFPSLPPKKQIPGWTPVVSNNRTRWDASAAPVSNPWAGSSSNSNDTAAAAAQMESGDSGEANENGNGKKKKGKQKQLLFHVGL